MAKAWKGDQVRDAYSSVVIHRRHKYGLVLDIFTAQTIKNKVGRDDA